MRQARSDLASVVRVAPGLVRQARRVGFCPVIALYVSSRWGRPSSAWSCFVWYLRASHGRRCFVCHGKACPGRQGPVGSVWHEVVNPVRQGRRGTSRSIQASRGKVHRVNAWQAWHGTVGHIESWQVEARQSWQGRMA